jgi:hypothetical protein
MDHASGSVSGSHESSQGKNGLSVVAQTSVCKESWCYPRCCESRWSHNSLFKILPNDMLYVLVILCTVARDAAAFGLRHLALNRSHMAAFGQQCVLRAVSGACTAAPTGLAPSWHLVAGGTSGMTEALVALHCIGLHWLHCIALACIGCIALHSCNALACLGHPNCFFYFLEPCFGSEIQLR